MTNARTMRAFRVLDPKPAAEGPLERVEVAVPEPGPDELLVEVLACGVCRTDLHVAEGDLPVHRRGVVPGHEVVGRVVGDRSAGRAGSPRASAWASPGCAAPAGRAASAVAVPRTSARGRSTPGGTPTAATPTTRPCPRTTRTGCRRATRDAELAPLLCAGIIGYHALRRAELPAGGRLGVYGFGGSAHLATQVALAEGATVHVMTRSPDARGPGARVSVPRRPRDAADRPPEPLDAAILFAPAGELVPPALAGPRPRRDAGGRRHPPQRHPGARLPAPPVPGAHAAQRHLEHPGRRARVPAPRRRAPPRGHAPSPTRWTAPVEALADLAGRPDHRRGRPGALTRGYGTDPAPRADQTPHRPPSPPAGRGGRGGADRLEEAVEYTSPTTTPRGPGARGLRGPTPRLAHHRPVLVVPPPGPPRHSWWPRA